MSTIDIELNPVDFITIGTVGPKGRRMFYLQAGRGQQVVSLTLEKEQARALSEAINEMLDDLMARSEGRLPSDKTDLGRFNMDLREPIDPIFRVSQMGLGYDDGRDLVILVARELVIVQEGEDPDLIEAGVVRLWASRRQMRAMSAHAAGVVKQGRVDPQSNGRLLYYWT
jgi:uncharacterized repeat protein (TIGR03847 family)